MHQLTLAQPLKPEIYSYMVQPRSCIVSSGAPLAWSGGMRGASRISEMDLGLGAAEPSRVGASTVEPSVDVYAGVLHPHV